MFVIAFLKHGIVLCIAVHIAAHLSHMFDKEAVIHL